MSVVITQDIESRYIPGKEAEFNYTLRGAATEAEAGLELAAVAPALYQGLWRKQRTIEAVHVDIENTTQNIFKARVLYGPADPTDFTTTFDTTGGSQHITQSPLTVNRYPANAPNMQGAIGYDGHRVNGTDIIIPAYSFTETHIKTKSQVNLAYRTALARLTGKTNNASFRGFAAGEVLFYGASGNLVVIENEQRWQVQYTFKVSPNRADFYVGDILVGQKVGWDYMWVMYGEAIDQSRLVQRPVAVYVERPYLFDDFGDLTIGTS